MKVVVLAAGKGQRLRGIVHDVPKPMVRVKGKPVLEHNIEWLARFGLQDIYINLHHLPNVIKYYLKDGSNWGVRISYCHESELLGTAGAVKKISVDFWSQIEHVGSSASQGQEPFLVVYGDNLLSEFDLNKVLDFHRLKGGIGTVCLYHKQGVSQSGIAVIDNDDKIMRFIEKPDPSQAVSNLVNTGVYALEHRILDYIPEDTFYDFGKDVFPNVISSGEKLYGIVLDAELTAIDTPELLRGALGRSSET